jgi:NADH-quinone oxidoreductase subunit L
MIYQAIVFLPLIGALLAVPVGRTMGDRAAELLTTALLMVAALLSWLVFIDIGFGESNAIKVPVMRWITSGELDVPHGRCGSTR